MVVQLSIGPNILKLRYYLRLYILNRHYNDFLKFKDKKSRLLFYIKFKNNIWEPKFKSLKFAIATIFLKYPRNVTVECKFEYSSEIVNNVLRKKNNLLSEAFKMRLHFIVEVRTITISYSFFSTCNSFSQGC